MRFASPGWLWLLLFLPLVYALLAWDDHGRRKRFEAFARRSVWPVIAPELDLGARARRSLAWVLAMACVILAMARPQWGTHEETARMSGLDVMVVLDVSNSMETEDVVPSRLKKAKHLIRDLAAQLEGNRLGLVSFAGGASVATPLTTDIDYFLEELEIQTPRLMLTQGTDIGLGLETAMHAMERGAANPAAPSEPHTQPSRAIVLVTDGEDFEGMAEEAASKLKSAGIRLYVFGVGTEKGGPVPIRDDSGQLINYKRDRAGQPVISSFHPRDLVKVASLAGGRYWNVTNGEAELDQLLRDLGALRRGEFAEHRYLVYEERFQYPLFLAVLLLLLEISLSYRKRKPAPGTAAMAAFALVMASALPARPARASDVDTYVENRKGVEAYQQGKTEEAERHFGAAQARNPALPELQYNQGLVQMQRGDAESAVRDFQQAARGSALSGNARLLGRSDFNLGAAQAKKGDIPGAIGAYLAAIQAARQTHDSGLEKDARKNLQLLVEQQEQKQKQQQQQQQQQKQDQQSQQNQKQQSQARNDRSKSGQNSQSKQDQERQQQQQQQQQQEQGQQQPKTYDTSDPRERKFESKKLTAEDAERVMSELTSRERDLQVQMKRQNEVHSSDDKDW